ncbi:unnamed protein product [Mortierella alpina]
MQQDPSASSSWNKPLYRAQPDPSSASSAASASSSSSPPAPSVSTVSAQTHSPGPGAAASVAAIGIAQTTIHARSSRPLPGTARPSSSASIPCLTSSHVRPNLNRNSDVLAIHQSFDLAKPSPSSPPSLQQPTDVDTIDAMVAFRSDPEQSAAGGASSSLLKHPHPHPHPQQDQLPQQQWPQYSSVSSLCLRGRRDGFQQDMGAGGRALRRTDEVKIESTGTSSSGSSDMEFGSPPPLRDRQTATATMKHNRAKQTRVSKSHMSSVVSDSAPGHGHDHDLSRPLQDHAPVPGAHTVLDASGASDSQRVHIHSSHANLDSIHVQTLFERRAIPSLANDRSRMSPGDICHLSSSCISPSSSRTSKQKSKGKSKVSQTTSATAATPSSTSAPAPAFASTASPNQASNPLSEPSLIHYRLNNASEPTVLSDPDIYRDTDSALASLDPSHIPSSAFITIRPDLSDTSSLPQPAQPKQKQNQASSSQIESGRRPIFLPSFLSGVRPLNIQTLPSIHGGSSAQQEGQRSKARRSSQSHTIQEAERSNLVVTDVRSISIRDISSVPILTTFSHRRTKRRNSTSNPPASTSSLPSTSRRKRIKKSSSASVPAALPLNLCTTSCGCSKSHSAPTIRRIEEALDYPHPSTAQTTSASTDDLPADRSRPPMESTGRNRTRPETEFSDSGVNEPSHTQLHPHDLPVDRPSALRPQGPNESGSKLPQRQPQSHNHSHSHTLHPHRPDQNVLASLHPIQPDTLVEHAEIVRSHAASRNRHQLRLELHQDKEQSVSPQHKRQRSPQTKTAFRCSTISTATNAESLERLKRARHVSSASVELMNPDVGDGTTSNTPASRRGRMNEEGPLSGGRRDVVAQALHPLETPQLRQSGIIAPTRHQMHGSEVFHTQKRHSRVHPFDREPTGSKPDDSSSDELSCSSSSSSMASMQVNVRSPKLCSQDPSSGEASIHPLDSDRVTEASTKNEHHAAVISRKIVNSTTAVTTPDTRHGGATILRNTLGPSIAVNTSQRERAIAQPQVHRDTAVSKEQMKRPASIQQSTHSPLAQIGPAQPAASSSKNLQLPITRATLRELDLLEIFKNPQLRHDIVFDPHLQFRPNFDGERGLRKRREADRFWREVGVELNTRRSILSARREAAATMLSLAGLSASSPSSRLIQQQAQQMCPLPTATLLPRLIDELREILLSLLPAAPAPAAAASPDGAKASQARAAPPISPERAQLMSTLDPDLLLQELDHGVLDVYALFRFLGDSLKGHCAPMRDALVESMVSIVVDSEEIVRGIRMCFEILEWMKLDIANHQLRTLRPWLLDNSIDFEQKYFTELLTRGGSLQRTRAWFKATWIQWEAVKQSVLGKPSPASSPSCRSSSSLSPQSLTLASTLRETEPSTGVSRSSLSPVASMNAKRRSSLVSTDIGENILDGVVNEGLLEMILHPHGAVHTMPETFELDHYRLVSFHNDFQDLTILCTLLILFRQLAQNCWTQQDLIEIKKVVWLLLTDENANFGVNTNTGSNSTLAGPSSTRASQVEKSSGSSGMKDIVIQIEFAARKVRERSKTIASGPVAASGSRRLSIAPETPLLTNEAGRVSDAAAAAQNPSVLEISTTSGHGSTPALLAPELKVAPPTPAILGGLSTSDTNLLTAWLDNALCRTSTLYKLIQKRLLIHFRRWLYLHSSASMLILSASCASLASVMSMSSSAEGLAKAEEEEEDEPLAAEKNKDVDGGSEQVPTGQSFNGHGDGSGRDSGTGHGNGNGSGNGSAAAGSSDQEQPPPNDGQTPSPTSKSATDPATSPTPAQTSAPAPAPAPAPTLSPEEANKAAAEALAAKLSFDAGEMEAHGLTGLEDEMIALLDKIRAVSEFNKKVYGSWYRDLVKEGRAENWLDNKAPPSSSPSTSTSSSSSTSSSTSSLTEAI